MRYFKIYLIFLLLLICSSIVCAEGEFIGKAVVTTDQHYYSKWSSLIGFYVPPICAAGKIYPGEIVDIRFFISNMALNEAKECDVTADIDIIDETGKFYYRLKEIKVMKQIVFVDMTLLSESYQRLRFSEKDQPGKYQIKVTFNDNISKKKVVSESEIELIAYGSDKIEFTYQQLEKQMWTYYERPNSHLILDFFQIIQKYIDLEGVEFGQIFASMFRAFFKDNDYLVPHLIKYLKNLDSESRKKLFPVIKGITIDYPDIEEEMGLNYEEKMALQATEYIIISDTVFAKPIEIDMLALNFVAIGRIEPVNMIIRAVSFWAEEDQAKMQIGQTAAYSLLINSKSHPLFRAYVIAIEHRDVSIDPFTKEILRKVIQETEVK